MTRLIAGEIRKLLTTRLWLWLLLVPWDSPRSTPVC
jgi:hypothetical protein